MHVSYDSIKLYNTRVKTFLIVNVHWQQAMSYYKTGYWSKYAHLTSDSRDFRVSVIFKNAVERRNKSCWRFLTICWGASFVSSFDYKLQSNIYNTTVFITILILINIYMFYWQFFEQNWNLSCFGSEIYRSQFQKWNSWGWVNVGQYLE